jgi:hypothetical protein
MPSFDLQFLPGHLSDGEGRRQSVPLRGRIESYYIQHICLFLLVSVNQDASHGVPDRGKKAVLFEGTSRNIQAKNP